MMVFEKPLFKRGLNISLNRGFDFELLKCEQKGFIREVDFGENVKVCSASDFAKEDFDFGNEDYFSSFNQKNASDVLFLFLKDNSVSDKPLVLSYSNMEGLFVSNVFILAGKNSKVDIVLKWKSKNKIYCGAAVKVLAKEGSKVNVVSVYDFEGTSVVQRKFGKCLQGAEVNWKELVMGGDVILSDIQNFLEGENAKSEVASLFVSKGREVFDLNSEVFHNSSLTESKIFMRGASLDSSQSISRGLIRIEENSFDCKGYEKHDVLLLGDEAEADAIPQLEILNDKVECSHGTSIGRLDEDSIFYLMSRGLSEEEAEFEILQGYFSFVDDWVLSEELRQEIYKKLADSVVL